jgi:hypothetical protein
MPGQVDTDQGLGIQGNEQPETPLYPGDHVKQLIPAPLCQDYCRTAPSGQQ